MDWFSKLRLNPVTGFTVLSLGRSSVCGYFIKPHNLVNLIEYISAYLEGGDVRWQFKCYEENHGDIAVIFHPCGGGKIKLAIQYIYDDMLNSGVQADLEISEKFEREEVEDLYAYLCERIDLLKEVEAKAT